MANVPSEAATRIKDPARRYGCGRAIVETAIHRPIAGYGHFAGSALSVCFADLLRGGPPPGPEVLP